MAENTTVGHKGQTSVADVIELARRDIARTQTDFLGRMNACLMDYEAICDDHPDGDFGDDKQEADEAISSLAGLALAQVMMLRGEEAPTDNLIAAAPDLLAALQALEDAQTALNDADEHSEQAEAEGWLNDPTGSGWVSESYNRANKLFDKATELRRAALLKASPRAGEGV